MQLKKPLVNSRESITSIVGPYMEKLNSHFTYAIKCPPATDFETYMSRGPKEIQESREMVGDLMGELRKHGYYPDISREDSLQFIRLMVPESDTQIDLHRGKDTPQAEGQAKLRAITKRLVKNISQ